MLMMMTMMMIPPTFCPLALLAPLVQILLLVVAEGSTVVMAGVLPHANVDGSPNSWKMSTQMELLSQGLFLALGGLNSHDTKLLYQESRSEVSCGSVPQQYEVGTQCHRSWNVRSLGSQTDPVPKKLPRRYTRCHATQTGTPPLQLPDPVDPHAADQFPKLPPFPTFESVVSEAAGVVIAAEALPFPAAAPGAMDGVPDAADVAIAAEALPLPAGVPGAIDARLSRWRLLALAVMEDAREARLLLARSTALGKTICGCVDDND